MRSRALLLAVIAGVAVTGALGQYAITEAFRRGEASVIAPFEYTALAWGLALDWFVWSVAPAWPSSSRAVTCCWSARTEHGRRSSFRLPASRSPSLPSPRARPASTRSARG